MGLSSGKGISNWREKNSSQERKALRSISQDLGGQDSWACKEREGAGSGASEPGQ